MCFRAGTDTGRATSLSFVLIASACSPSLSSPPSHLHHFASPVTASSGSTAITGSASAGGEVFGPDVVAAEVQVRHGFDDRTELGGSVSVAVLPGDQLADPPHRAIYAARVVARHVLFPRVLTFDAGIGGGGSAGGGYFSPDAGLTFGFENPYVVPYAFGTFLVSVPITKRTLDVRMADETTPDLRRPFSTFGTQFGLGVRIPLGPHERPYGSIFVEASALALYGDDPYDGSDGIDNQRAIVTAGLAYQHVLPARSP